MILRQMLLCLVSEINRVNTYSNVIHVFVKLSLFSQIPSRTECREGVSRGHVDIVCSRHEVRNGG